MRSPAAFTSVFSVTLALVVCFIAVALTQMSGVFAWEAYVEMFRGGLGDFARFSEEGDWTALLRPWGETLTKATLLTLTGLSVGVALTVGLFNLGAHGQFLFGAVTAAALGFTLRLPSAFHPWLCVLAAALAGAAYAWVPAFLKLRRGVHEVISTIMLNWIAICVVENWWVVGPLRAREVGGHSRSGTEDIFPSAVLPRFWDDLSRLHAGLFVALAACVLVWLWLKKSVHGFESRAVGQAPHAASASGIPVARRTYQAMLLSGALAGTAGALWVLGTEYKFPATVSGSYGFDGIAMALLGQSHPLGIALVSLVFGALRAGGTAMQFVGVHKSFPELIQGLALLFIAAGALWQRLLWKKKALS